MRQDGIGQRKVDYSLAAPDSTAMRVALWRAMHVEVDAPHVFVDEVGSCGAG
jgi:hypothetical protein